MSRRRKPARARLGFEYLEDRSVPAAGVLDPTFSGDGKLSLDINPVDQDVTLPMVLGVQPDGKLLVAGNATAGNVAGTQVFRVNTDGTLDATFSPAASDPIYDGGDGTAWLSSGTTFLADPEEIVVQADGKIIVVGNFAVVRLSADGRPDPTFGTGGTVRTVASAGGPLTTTSGHFYSAAIQPDGKILLAGTNVSGNVTNTDFVLARLNANGTWDSSFGTGGAVYTNIDGTDTGYDVALQPDGKIVVGGSTRFTGDTLTRFAAARYNPNGTLDTTFAGDGTFTADLFPTLNHEIAYGVALQSDGKVVLSGSCGFSSTTDFAAARLNTDGTVDTSFGTNGAGAYDMGVASSIAYSVAIDAADRIVLGGWGYTMHYAVARLTPAGAPDVTFDGDGKKVTLVGESASGQNNQTARDVAIRPDGSIVMSGRAYAESPFEGTQIGTAYTTNNIGLQVMNPDGTPDATFSGDGFGFYARQRYSTDDALGVALQTDGKVIIVGSTGQFFGSYDDFAVARLNANGTPDSTFGGDGDVAVAFGTSTSASEDNAAAAVVQPDGKIVVVGSINLSIVDEKMGIARLNPDGTPDTTFGTGGQVVVNPTTMHDNLFAVAVQPDGKIVAAGTVNNAGSIDFAVIRLNADGSLDASFGTGGVWTGNLAGTASERLRSIVIQPDGKIVLAGGTTSTAGGIVVRLTPTGALDTSFNGTGYRVMSSFVVSGTQTMTVYDLTAVTLDSAGRVVVAGKVLNNPAAAGYDFFAARLNPNGSFDTTFDADGYRAIAVGTGAAADEAWGVAVQQNGRIVLTGTTSPAANTYDFAATRLNPDGSTDTTFGTNGKATYDLSGTAYGYPDLNSDDFGRAMALEPGGNIVIVGYGAKVTGINAAASDIEAVRVIGDQLPTDIALSPASINENAGANAAVGTLTTADPDAGDTHTYTLVPGAGGANNAEFTIVGNELRALVSFDHELTPTRTVRIRTTDQTGSYYEEVFAITVLDANEAPVAAAEAFTTDEDVQLVVAAPGVLANDTDPENQAISPVLVNGPAHGTLALAADGSFVYTPAANYNGPDSFTYRASDGALVSAAVTVTITVNPVNDAPTAAAQSATTAEDTPLSGAVTATDIDSPALTFALLTGPAHGTLALDATTGAFTYTPDANYNGPDSFTFTAGDGSLTSAPATVTITVAAANDAPTATADSYSANEDAALSVAAPGVLGNDADVDGDALSAVLVSGPAHGTLVLNADGSFAYAPVADWNGTDAFTYRASDGGLTSELVMVTITVTAVNDAPVASGQSVTTGEDTPLSGTVTGADIDSPALTFASLTGPAHGTLTLSASGAFTYTPDANYNGPDSFTFTAGDGSLTSAPATVTITVAAANDAPTATADSYSANEDAALSVAAPGVLGNDADVDGDALSAVLVSGPAHGTLALNPNGSFTYTPAANYNGPDSFTYRSSDGTAQSGTVTVSLTVAAVNDAPVAIANTYTTTAGTALNVPAPGVLLNDTDVDGNTLTAVLATGPAHGTLTLNANGSFTYTPAGGFSGNDSFTYLASDGAATSAPVTVTITVSASGTAGATLVPDPCDPTKTALLVRGTAGNDTIVITPAGNCGGGVTVKLNGTNLGTFHPSGRVIVYALAGDDDIQTAGAIARPIWAHGGTGADRLKGGSGDDVLLGEDGDDLVVGGDGRDLLIGGEGGDRLVGNAADDILIAGFTDHDGNDHRLCDIMDEWTSCRSFAVRVQNLTSAGGCGARENGTTFLNPTTVHDDGRADVLTGSAGSDWFLFNQDGDGGARDEATDMSNFESRYDTDIDFIYVDPT